jgi:integrase
VAYKKGEPVFTDKKKTVRESAIWYLADGKGYLVDFSVTDPETGKRVRLRKATHRLSLAREWRDKQKGDALRGEIRGRGPKKVAFEKFADAYYEAWKEGCRDSTAYSEKNRIDGVLKPCFGSRQIHTITRKDIETFLRKRRDGSLNDVVVEGRREHGVTKATTNRDLCRLKNMFKKAVEWGYLKENPAAGIPQSKEAFEPADYLEADEVEKFLEYAEESYRPVFVTAVYTGMRFGEIMRLEWEDVDFRWNNITVRSPKNNETRHIPMNRQVKEMLDAIKQEEGKVFVNPETGKPYTDVRKAMRRALDK